MGLTGTPAPNSYLNTSHVKVQHIADILGRAEELDLNTSHVKVQRPHKDVYKELNG
ncbi:hypothetical protein [Clostridium sp. HV4-5-A1G]|uniref:hypothetical protein n=1 Tax=Clostridium sp. HV4-5-A1G TaxID=2004595 RepID=UPI003FA4779E